MSETPRTWTLGPMVVGGWDAQGRPLPPVAPIDPPLRLDASTKVYAAAPVDAEREWLLDLLTAVAVVADWNGSMLGAVDDEDLIHGGLLRREHHWDGSVVTALTEKGAQAVREALAAREKAC